MYTDIDITRTIDTHLAAYGEPDPNRRAELLAAVWVADGRLADPPFEATSRDEIAALVDAVLAQYPGHTFRRTSVPDLHHGTARYTWELRDPAGTAVLTGLDVARVTDDGLLAEVVGFFGEPEAAEVAA